MQAEKHFWAFGIETGMVEHMKTGLVLEGGAMRGIYTAGVLDAFMENRIFTDGVIGVSAGAIHGCSYVSGQHGRSIRYYMKYMRDPRFMSFRSLLRTGNLVDTKFCYDELPNRLDVFDYDAFEQSPMKFYVVCTNVETGKAEYIHMKDMREIAYVQASASMPMVSRIVEVGDRKLLDGGVADSIPIRQFISMGYEKNIVVLTRPEGYQKKPARMGLLRKAYRKYPEFTEAMEYRYIQYNRALEELTCLEKEGQVLVIRPSRDPGIGRMEKRPEKVRAVYQLGYTDAIKKMDAVKTFLQPEHIQEDMR